MTPTQIKAAGFLNGYRYKPAQMEREASAAGMLGGAAVGAGGGAWLGGEAGEHLGGSVGQLLAMLQEVLNRKQIRQESQGMHPYVQELRKQYRIARMAEKGRSAGRTAGPLIGAGAGTVLGGSVGSRLTQ
jgi:hypothetical protein